MELEERFWSKVDFDLDGDGCWMWTKRTTRDGYGRIKLVTGVMALAHRLAYELEVGTIPDGFVIDHVCHDPKKCVGGVACPHRRCCNPSHMKPTTRLENTSSDRSVKPDSRTHCPRGHEYDESNTRWYKGERYCRACDRARPRRKKD